MAIRPQGVYGSWGEGPFIFTRNYFNGAGEQAHTFGILGSTARKVKEKSFMDFGRSEHYFWN